MKLLTLDAVVPCKHVTGLVALQATQAWATVSGRPLLLHPDPEGRPIAGCPNYGATIKPCTTTLPVESGTSAFVRVGGRRVCLDTLTGLTDGTPPGVVKYEVRSAGQAFVEADA